MGSFFSKIVKNTECHEQGRQKPSEPVRSESLDAGLNHGQVTK